jgi:hypothetical protein
LRSQNNRNGIERPFKPRRIKKKEIRKAGGGRKKSIEKDPQIAEMFLSILKDHTAGDPGKEGVIWTDLSVTEIIRIFKIKGKIVGASVVKSLLVKYGYKKRKIMKRASMGKTPNRNEQFETIVSWREDYQKEGNPVISCDTKKKEFIGQLFRQGTVYSQVEIVSLDHDFPHLSKGIAIPYGIFDITKNKAYIYIGTSHDTAEFVCDGIKKWWYEVGQIDYPNATSILILVDGGGSNSSRHYVFKQALQNLVDEIKIEIRIAHYPPYTSKWNPIEHRLFPHITRSMQGLLLTSHDMVKKLLEKTTTQAGLKVIAHITDKVYETGKTVTKEFKENMKIIFDDFLGKWNYKAVPTDNQVL